MLTISFVAAQVSTVSHLGDFCSLEAAGMKPEISVPSYCLETITAFDTGSQECSVFRIFSTEVFGKPVANAFS